MKLSVLSCATLSALLAAPAAFSQDLFTLSLEELMNTEVTTASLVKESLQKTPVPVTVITESMIAQASASTIKDLLVLYVPNFTHVEDQNEQNIAARGIFTSSQQKILFLIDGHRLNSRSYSMASPDHSMSLDKIKQIEVLRGPSSSLYGNVALTATVNIILKTPHELAGNSVKVATGNVQQKQVSITAGHEVAGVSTLLWGQYYQAKGQSLAVSPENDYARSPINDGYARIGAYDDKPSLDLGAKAKYGNFSLLANYRQAHYIEPYSGAGLTGEAYNYDKIKLFNDVGPGFGYQAWHLNTQYQGMLNNVNWHIEAYYDNNKTESVAVVSPYNNTAVAPSWQERSYGTLLHVSGTLDKLDYLLGAQIDHMQVYNSSLYQFDGENWLPQYFTSENNVTTHHVLEPGSENISSAFAQLKYTLSPNWLINLGARYDHKRRHTTANVKDFSPRLALIYQAQDGVNMKLSYATSFVDATYWNRYSKLPSFRGTQNLQPEKLSSWQFSPSLNLLENNLYVAGNIYYNRFEDVIYRDNQANSSQPNYSNAGKLESWGLEAEARYHFQPFTLHATAGYQAVIEAERYQITGSKVNNVPSVSANLLVDWQLDDAQNISAALRYIGKQESPIMLQLGGDTVSDPYPNEGVDYYAPDHQINAAWLIDMKYRLKLSPHWHSNVNVKNLLDKQHQQGGSTVHPYQQLGRVASVELVYTW